MQSPTHIGRSLGFLSQETGTETFSSSHAKFQEFFPSSVSLAMVAISLVNLRNVFPLIASGVKAGASTWLLPSDLFRTYSQTFDRAANFSQSKRVFFPMCGFRESHHETSQPYFRLPQSRTYVRDIRPFSNGMHPSQLRTN